ncbi:MAG: hypothetical protein GX638_11385 [Crenarchaeota archaeon]|nr:hypothetical protein [Thermoproteota archaeon]
MSKYDKTKIEGKQLVEKGVGLITAIIAFIIGALNIISGIMPDSLFVQSFFIIDGVIYLIFGIGMLLSKLQFFYGMISWVIIETSLLMYWQGTGVLAISDATSTIIYSVFTGISFAFIGLCGYHIGKTKRKN